MSDSPGGGGAVGGGVEDEEGATAAPTTLHAKKLLLCRRFKDSGGVLRNFNSLPLFVYATSTSTHATSADGVGVARETAAAAALFDKHDIAYDMARGSSVNHNGSSAAMDCLPMNGRNGLGVSGGGGGSGGSCHPTSTTPLVGGSPGALVVLGSSGGGGGISSIQHQLNLSHHLGQAQHHHHPAHHMLSHHHSPYSNNYPLHHVVGGGLGMGIGGGIGVGASAIGGHHHHIHSDQTKSLQELQHEVGALLEFRDLVIETFPDLKHKMASMSSSSASAASSSGGLVVMGGSGGGSVAGGSGNASVSTTNTLTGGAMSSSSLASRREWEPGIRVKRKLSQKEPPSTSAASTAAGAAPAVAVAAGELSSSSLTRSRSNSHSGKKEPKSGGENNNGSVVQDSGFSTETSSSKEGHSASSTNGAMTVAIASNRLSCPESDDELLNLLDVIHRKSNRLREEVEHLQNYERQTLRANATTTASASGDDDVPDDEIAGKAPVKSGGGEALSTASGALTPQTFREHVERLSREDIKQLRKERDRLLDKLAEMEAETLTGRIKAAKMSDQVEELISVKKDLEEQLKLAMAQKLELSSRVQQLQQPQSKSSSSQSDYSSQRNFLSSATTVLSTGGSGTGSGSHQQQELAPLNRRPNTFQPVVVEQQPQPSGGPLAFHQSAGSDSRQPPQQLGRLDGVVSTPGGRNTKCRATDSERIAAILLETSVIELQRHLLTLTVQNQVLMQKLDAAGKSKIHLAKRLDKSKDDVEDLRFQLEEKNIELEGTKAQLRVLESRMRSSTPCSVAATNSYLNHSQNDYETNRSSASTTLMLSRRGLSSTTSGGGGSGIGIDISHSSEARSTTPTSQLSGSQQQQQMPQPPVTQISTPSMKAMVHLPMDEIQHHSSSTESAHEHELLHLHHHNHHNLHNQQQQQEHDQLRQALNGQRLLSTSVGGISPFEQKKKSGFIGGSAASKPSKIPLPGSKTVTYFTMSGKPPTGRHAIAGGRSPPSAGSTTGSSASSKSSLSRSTGNLLYSKSPNSLKRADSAQSIRKELNNSSSLSTNTSRSSTSSSIPMATTPYAGGYKSSSGASATAAVIASTPSPRLLQNSPLPKPKRDSLTSRVRHLDSLSRVHQHNSNTSQSDVSPSATVSPVATGGGGGSGIGLGVGYLVSSTPKPTSAIAAHLNSSLRKELQLGSSSFSQGSQQFLRRATGGQPAAAATNASGGGAGGIARRFGSNSTASTVLGAGARFNAARLQEQQANATAAAAVSTAHDAVSTGSAGGGSVNGGGVASDSDSGKNSVLYQSRNYTQAGNVHFTNVPSNLAKPPLAPAAAHTTVWTTGSVAENLTTQFIANRPLSHGNQKAALRGDILKPTPAAVAPVQSACNALIDITAINCCADEQQLWGRRRSGAWADDGADKAMDEQYYSNCSFSVLDSCCERGSDNLLVTFDYGSWNESMEAQRPEHDMSRSHDDEKGVALFAAYAFNARVDDGQQQREVYDQAAEERKWARQVDDGDDDAIWFAQSSMGSRAKAAEVQVEDVAAAFPVHRMRHKLKRSQISLFTSYAEDDFSEAINECPTTAPEIPNKHFYFVMDEAAADTDNDIKVDGDAMDGTEPDDENDVEEEFYDSIECARVEARIASGRC